MMMTVPLVATNFRVTSVIKYLIDFKQHTFFSYFSSLSRDFLADLGGAEGLLLVQCDNGERNFNLIACCRYLVDDSRRRTLEVFKASEKPVKPVHIIFVIQLPKIGGGCQHFVGFQGGKWQSVHIDELLESSEQLPQIEQLVNRSVSDLFQPANTARDDNVYELEVEQRGEDIQDVDFDTNLTSERNERLAEVNKNVLCVLKNSCSLTIRKQKVFVMPTISDMNDTYPL